MMRKRISGFGLCWLIVALGMGLIFKAPAIVSADEATADALVDEGRLYLAQQDIVSANDCFRRALLEDEANREANVFYAVTRLIVILYGPEFSAFLDRAGITAEGRDVYNWTADWTRDGAGEVLLPPDTPWSGEVVDFLVNTVVPEIDGALDNLDRIRFPFELVLEPAEILSGEQLEVDDGDVLLYRAALHAAKSLIQIVASYDLDMDIYDLSLRLQEEFLSINDDILGLYPSLLNLNSPDHLLPAKEAIGNAIELYYLASTAIREETDDQVDDFITFDYESLTEEEAFRNVLADVKASLSGPARIGEDEVERPLLLDLTRFFDDSFALRDMLPLFDWDNSLIPCTLPDPTFNLMLPELTMDTVNETLHLPVPLYGTVICPECTYGSMVIEAYSEGDLKDIIILDEPGDFSLSVPVGEEIWMWSYWDRDDNGYYNIGDAYGGSYVNINVMTEECRHPDFFPFVMGTVCLGDMDGDDDSDSGDVAMFADAFGATACSGDCPADLDGDLEVDGRDLFMMGASLTQFNCY